MCLKFILKGNDIAKKKKRKKKEKKVTNKQNSIKLTELTTSHVKIALIMG